MARTDPSPAEIAALCREIQSAWSEVERWSRLRSDWRAAFRRVDGQRIEFDASTYNEHHGKTG